MRNFSYYSIYVRSNIANKIPHSILIKRYNDASGSKCSMTKCTKTYAHADDEFMCPTSLLINVNTKDAQFDRMSWRARGRKVES